MILTATPYIPPEYAQATNREAQLFSPMADKKKNVGRVLMSAYVPFFICNGSGSHVGASISTSGISQGISTDISGSVSVLPMSSQKCVVSVVYPGPAIFSAVVTVGPSIEITVQGTRADPYGISVEVGDSATLILKGGLAYGWPDDGVVVPLPFNLAQDTEYYLELAWNHTTGDHSIFIDGTLMGTVNVVTATEGTINKIVPGTNLYLKTDIAAQQIIDNLVLSNSDTRDLSRIREMETSPKN